MKNIRSIHLRSLQGRLGDIAYQLTRISYCTSRPHEGWCPAINVYRYSDRIAICVELAGVDPAQFKLLVEPRRVRISGRRQTAEPTSLEGPPLQILALEIDHGPFEREINLPFEVDPKRVQAEQKQGLLWILLPLIPNA
jgi:HSP20 family protein